MAVTAAVLATWMLFPLAAPPPKTQILPFTAATPDTDAQAVKEIEGLYRDAMQRVLNEQLVGGGQTREELVIAAKDNPALRTVTSENVKQLPGMFSLGPIQLGEVRGQFPDVRVVFRSYDGSSRTLMASHTELFTMPGSRMAERLQAVARYMAEAHAVSGGLEIQCNNGTGQVLVDGHPVVECPGGVRVTPIGPGNYLLALTGAGPSVDQVEANVIADRVTTVNVTRSGDRSMLVQKPETGEMPGEAGTPLVGFGAKAATGAATSAKPPTTEAAGGTSPIVYLGGGLLAGGAVAALAALVLVVGGGVALAAVTRMDASGPYVLAAPFEPAGMPFSLTGAAFGAAAAAGVAMLLAAGAAAVGGVIVLVMGMN